jgi:hypothetical protein
MHHTTNQNHQHNEIHHREFETYTYHTHSLLEQAAEHRKVVAEEQTAKTEKKEEE